MTDTKSIPYTRNWTGRCVRRWFRHLKGYRRWPTRMLEIGVFEGRSAKWFLDNILVHPQSQYIGIDPWDVNLMSGKGFPHNAIGEARMRAVERLARETLSPYGGKVSLYHGRSKNVLSSSFLPPRSLDISYIDGMHSYRACKADSWAVWPLLKQGGVLIWDDVNMKRRGHGKQDVRRAVDEFLAANTGQWVKLWETVQVAVRKL